MREIKYRAWDTKKNTWCNIIVIDLNGNLYFSTSSQGNGEVVLVGPLNKDIIILQQYTGLKDRNGKEIYEGDIVNDGAKVYKKIGFNFGSFTLDLIDGRIDCSLFDCTPSIFIVGNIYENPELLENKK